MSISLTFPAGGVLVAGGTGKIGHGVVEGFARAGLPVLFTYLGGGGRDSENKAHLLTERLTANGWRVRGRRMDMRRSEEIEAALDELEGWAGRVHTVVATAGALVPFAKTADYAPDELETYIQGDGLAYFRLFRGAVQRMRKTGGGSIACTTTIDVGRLARYNGASGMSKALVEAMMRHIAVEEAPSIRSNYIRIGFVGPNSFADHPDWVEPPVSDPKTRAEMLHSIVHSHVVGIPMGRPGSLREIGDVFAFLASDQASYLTGQCLQMDGGEDR
jgi:NAD(P)-dependent dehydrogenase (short-subunit alcohol dehydrogenase family)